MKKIIFVAVIIFMCAALGTAMAKEICHSNVGGFCVKIPDNTRLLSEKKINTGLAQIPGLEFLGLKSDAEPGDILVKLYVFGIGLVGICALVVLVAAGVWYITAGDNTQRVGQAKGWMGNAIFGLVLALLSYLILFTINPSLVGTLNLHLEQITAGTATGGNVPSGFCFNLSSNTCSLVTCDPTATTNPCAGNNRCVNKDSCPH